VNVCPNNFPRSVEQQLQTEIGRLLEIGALEEDYDSEWPTSQEK
jgi:hypothetical protein